MANLKAAGIVISICLYGGSLFAQQDDAHRAYEEAVGIKKVEQRIAALEAFLVQQPPSELQKKALGQLLADYLVVRSLDLQEKTAKRLLAIDEKNLRALALLVYACHSGDRD